MEKDPAPKRTFYQITIEGTLDPARRSWFDGLEIHTQDGLTVLAGSLPDPQALYGVIERIRDLGMKLVEVKQGEE